MAYTYGSVILWDLNFGSFCEWRHFFHFASDLKTDHSKLNTFDVYFLKVHLEVFSCCVPEETHIDANYDWKTTQSSNTFLKKRIWRVLSRSSFGSFFLAAFLKKRASTLITTRKQHKVLKVRQISVYALTVRLSLWISALVHEVSDRQQSIRGKEELNGTWVR